MICRRTPLPQRAAGLLIVVLALAPLRGEETPIVKINGESKATTARFDEARKQFDERKWSEAIEQLQAILNGAGNDLVPLNPPDSTHLVQARRLCQVQLAALPPEGLRLYRQRYESQARKSWEQAKAERDPLPLRRIVEEMFCTRAAEKAIDLLGDLAFERGRFEEAEEWWRLLSPLPDARRDAATRGFALVYPDLSLDPARIQAKQMLARLFDGRGGDWPTELDAYRTRHGKAEGQLAGRKGRYADLLAALAEERKKTAIVEPLDWPTFGGDSSRGRVVPAPDDILDRLSALCRDGPTWSFNLAEHGQPAESVPESALNAKQARSLAFYPIIVGHQVVVADAQYVTRYDVRSGAIQPPYDVGNKKRGVKVNLELPALKNLRYTLTAADDNIYVRLGAQDIGLEVPPEAPRAGRPAKPRRENETFLTCLRLRPDREQEAFRWEVRGILDKREKVHLFEGAPLVANGQIWIASTHYSNESGITSIDCYPADEPKGPPPLRWRRDICERGDLKVGEPRHRHHLLTLAGTQLVYCTHNGAVVAVDALTGRTNWAIRYPRDEDGENDLKDLAPVFAGAGRLYVAPADSNHLLCLDPATGRTLWMREDMKVVHLLGVGQGRLIFTTPGGLRAVGADDGEDSSGWMVPHSGGDLTPAGRGLLIGDLVLWPTVRHGDFSQQGRVYAVRQRDGMPAGDPSMLHRLPAGNLAYANGCLVVADLRTLSVFVPPRLLLPRRRADVKRHPESAPSLLQLGRAEADAGLPDKAVQTLRQAEAKVANMPKSPRKRLLHEARSERQRVLLETAQRAAKSKHWQDAATAAEQAAEVPLSARARLHALLRAAQIWKDAGQPARARAVWQSILADDELKRLQVIDRHGHPSPAATIAALRVGQAFQPDGPKGQTGKPDLHAPALPLFRSWHATLSRDEWVLGGWQASDPELLLTGSARGQLICRAASTGTVRWRHSVPFVPRWAGSHGDTIVAAGEGGAAGLRRDDGELLWYFPAPISSRTTTTLLDEVSVVVDPGTPEALTAFRLVSGRMFFLQGQHRLFALDAATGAVLWHRGAPDGGFRLPEPQGCFSPCYHAGPETVLIQMSGQRWLLDAAKGRLIHQAADSGDLWQRCPLGLDERTLCIVPHPRRIELIDNRTGQTLWTYPLPTKTTLSGEYPQVLGRGDVLFVVKPANIGYFLERLDRASGKPLWANPILLTGKTVDLSTWTFDQEAVYGIEEASLTARSLTDGKVVWQRSLDGTGGWQVRRVGDSLMVWPRPSAEDARFRFRSPLGALQWNLGPLLTPESVFTIGCRDPKTGQLVQRLNFRLESPARTTWRGRTTERFGGRFLMARTSSLLASEDGPVVQLDSPRPMIAAGAGVWGLSAAFDDKHRADAGR